MARRLAREFREARHLADAVIFEIELDDCPARLILDLLPDGGIKRLPVLGNLKVCRSLAAIDRLHDFRRARLGIALENLERVLVGRARVASDDAVDGGGDYGVHFPQISL